MDTLVRRFASRLHNLRMERGMTQEELASRAGLHPRFVSALERGLQVPSLLTLGQLAKGLKVELASFVDFPDPIGSKSDRVNEELELISQKLKNRTFQEVQKVRKIIDVVIG